MEHVNSYEKEAVQLLKSLIETPSFSSEESNTAKLIEAWFEQKGISYHKSGHNRYAFNKYFDPKKTTLLLNSHHDTVKPNSAYTLDPFKAIEKDGKIYGLGSNDAGGCLVCLLSTFAHFYDRKDLKQNLIMVASAEEESSGANGLNSVLPLLPKIDMAIVGEPTQMHLAIAEKGLVVLDGVVKGTPSHAAHPNSDQAIDKTAGVLNWFETYAFEKVSDFLGPVKMTVTQIVAGSQHNVIPGEVKLVVDVRVNDCYSNAEINELLQREAPLELKARSLRLGSSAVRPDHPLVIAGKNMGRETYGSPTLSDQAAISGPSMKLGPGDSTRSHTADEFIYRHEIAQGIEIYSTLLETYLT